MALIFEEAGGWASNGVKRILDIPVTDIHQRTPFYVGSIDDVMRLNSYSRFYS